MEGSENLLCGKVRILQDHTITMQHQQGIHPPILLTFEQTFEDSEHESGSNGKSVSDDAQPSSPFSVEEDTKVPKFMMRSTEEKLQQLLEEILQDHRCATCRRFLCCGSGVYHDVNCWSEHLKSQVSWDMIAGIRNYRLEVLNGSMQGWEEYAFETFDYYKHAKHQRLFRPHNYGFYVRCFSCLYCEKNSTVREVCNAPHHKHW